MEVKPGYKQTEVGVIPDDWDCARICDLARLESGHTPRRTVNTYWNGPIPWVSLHDTDSLDQNYIYHTAMTVTQHGIDNSSARLLPAGTVVFSRTATVGKAAILGRAMATSQDFANYVCGPKLCNLFVVYLFRGMARTWGSLMAGSTHKTIYMPTFEKLRIPVPSVSEQQGIAAALADVDHSLDGLERLIAKKRDLKQAAMQQLLTGHTRLPGFSGEWEVMRLGEFADVLKGSALSKSLIAASGTHPCILYGELFTTYGRVISDVVSRTNSSDGSRSVSGDVLLPGSTTTTGADLATASALFVEDVALGGDIIIVRRKAQSYDPAFLASYLTHTRRHEIAELTQGITIHHLYGKDLKTLSLQLPSLPEQTAIAAVLSDMDAELTALEARRDKTRDLKQAMMQELLTGKTRLVKPEAAHA